MSRRSCAEKHEEGAALFMEIIVLWPIWKERNVKSLITKLTIGRAVGAFCRH